MGVQDDRRELSQIELFRLDKPVGEGRSGIDAVLNIDGQEIFFELKSTTDGSVTTARDFGYDHIEKWRNKHFLISKFSKGGAGMEYTLYGGPSKMEPWIKAKEVYIKPDFDISEIAPQKLTLSDLFKILGEKNVYSIEDAKGLQKKQYSQVEYESLMDVESGYSQQRMLHILKERCKYVLRRGATLNNPHISKSFFDDWDIITAKHAEELRRLVRAYLSNT